jgi:hypothetical protein
MYPVPSKLALQGAEQKVPTAAPAHDASHPRVRLAMIGLAVGTLLHLPVDTAAGTCGMYRSRIRNKSEKNSGVFAGRGGHTEQPAS